MTNLAYFHGIKVPISTIQESKFTMTKKIWLVRHGESLSQIDPSVCGINPDLSPNGECQARLLKGRLAPIQVDRVLLSPLKRAWRTYQLSEHQAPEVVFDKNLIESDWGIPNRYDDSHFGDLPDFAKPDNSGAHRTPARERAHNLVERLVKMQCASCLLVGHWGIFSEILKAFLCVSDKMDFLAQTQNTGVSLLEVEGDGRRSVVFWNDAAHLPKILPVT